MQSLYNVANNACIQRDILSLHDPIAACNRTRKDAVLIPQGERQTVDLFFHNKLR